MENREIDRKIAELMGLRVIESYGDYFIGKDEDGEFDYSQYPDIVDGYALVPQYSTDWNDMRLLVEWLQGKGILGTISQLFENEWACALHKRNGYARVTITENDRYYADTAPLALCKAVLSMPPEVLHG